MSPDRPAPSMLDRRGFLAGAGASGIALGAATGGAYTAFADAPDYSLRIHGAG